MTLDQRPKFSTQVAGRLTTYIGLTDRDWYNFLSSRTGLEEVNFWQPSAATSFVALDPGEAFLFKLHSPDNYIVGGGFFAHWTKLPVSLAWDAFREGNGAATLTEMRSRIERYRRGAALPAKDYEIGCILLEQPFFLEKDEWIPVPGWHPSIQRGKTYDLNEEPGANLWKEVSLRLQARSGEVKHQADLVTISKEKYGKPILIQPRIGQGTFRVVVTDAYDRRCAVTGEKVLPVLEAAHIRPYADGGEHLVENGLLLRSDAHILFDRGYMTVTPKHRVEVSKRLKTDFDNGKQYLLFHGRSIHLPGDPKSHPSAEFLRWHNEERFLN